MKKILILLLLLPLLVQSQVVDRFNKFSACTALPLSGNGNAEEVVKDWSMDNAYDATAVTACGTGDNCINTVTNTTWSIDTTPSNGNVYCVNESLKLVSTSNNQLNGIQANFELTTSTVYDYTIGIYQESGDNARISFGFGTSGGTNVAHGDAIDAEWDYFSGSFTATQTDSQINLYVASAATGSTSDTVWYHITIKEQ